MICSSGDSEGPVTEAELIRFAFVESDVVLGFADEFINFELRARE